MQGNTKVIKLDSGQLAFAPETKNGLRSNELTYNTISTPRAAQYQLVLSDSTKVWLNAASSLRTGRISLIWILLPSENKLVSCRQTAPCLMKRSSRISRIKIRLPVRTKLKKQYWLPGWNIRSRDYPCVWIPWWAKMVSDYPWVSGSVFRLPGFYWLGQRF